MSAIKYLLIDLNFQAEFITKKQVYVVAFCHQITNRVIVPREKWQISVVGHVTKQTMHDAELVHDGLLAIMRNSLAILTVYPLQIQGLENT